MFAPTVNSYKRYQPESWAPTALAWGRDNRTCGFRLVGHGQGFRIESRIPGADCNPYLAFAATIAAGLHGIENKIEPPPMLVGNAYEAPDIPHVPWNIVDAISEFERSEVATRAFGEAVHQHLVHTAPGMGRVQPGRHGLGAPPQLRAVLRVAAKPLIAVPAYPVRSGADRGLDRRGRRGAGAVRRRAQAGRRAGGRPHARGDRLLPTRVTCWTTSTACCCSAAGTSILRPTAPPPTPASTA